MRLSDSLKQLGHPVAYYPMLSRVFGMPESVFIAQFVYWTGKQEDPQGWIYKTVEEIEYETGLSYEQQRRVRRALTASKIGAKGRKIKRLYVEAIIEENYDRNTHKMYFRVDMEALDRAFSQGQLFPTEQVDNVHVPVRECPPGTWEKSMSSIQRLPKRVLPKNSRGAHKEFVKFWDEMVVKIRGAHKYVFDDAGFRNLKLALKVTDESTLERLGLYFLADPKFSKYYPSLKVFLSSGIMKGLQQVQNRDGFSARLERYVDQYIISCTKGSMSLDVEQVLKELVNKLTIK